MFGANTLSFICHCISFLYKQTNFSWYIFLIKRIKTKHEYIYVLYNITISWLYYAEIQNIQKLKQPDYWNPKLIDNTVFLRKLTKFNTEFLFIFCCNPIMLPLILKHFSRQKQWCKNHFDLLYFDKVRQGSKIQYFVKSVKTSRPIPKRFPWSKNSERKSG